MSKKKKLTDFVINHLKVKHKNRRIELYFYLDNDKTPLVYIKTKRLSDFKERLIIETSNSYSLETFAAIHMMMNHITKDNLFVDLSYDIVDKFIGDNIKINEYQNPKFYKNEKKETD